jgi:hypothetical protein
VIKSEFVAWLKETYKLTPEDVTDAKLQELKAEFLQATAGAGRQPIRTVARSGGGDAIRT